MYFDPPGLNRIQVEGTVEFPKGLITLTYTYDERKNLLLSAAQNDLAVIHLPGTYDHLATNAILSSAPPQMGDQVTIAGYGTSSCRPSESASPGDHSRHIGYNHLIPFDGPPEYLDELQIARTFPPGDASAIPLHGDSGGPLLSAQDGLTIFGVASSGTCADVGPDGRPIPDGGVPVSGGDILGEARYARVDTNSARQWIEGAITPCIGSVSCSDGVQNGDEAGIDCGGSKCPPCHPCGLIEVCNNGKDDNCDGQVDCADWYCENDPYCVGIRCGDGLQNQGETGIDCGGPCSPCPATCTDGIKNQGETVTDCGGPCVGLLGYCPNGPGSDGWYCGDSSRGQRTDSLYYCAKGKWDTSRTVNCGSAGCKQASICENDSCDVAAVCGNLNCETNKGESCSTCLADCQVAAPVLGATSVGTAAVELRWNGVACGNRYRVKVCSDALMAAGSCITCAGSATGTCELSHGDGTVIAIDRSQLAGSAYWYWQASAIGQPETYHWGPWSAQGSFNLPYGGGGGVGGGGGGAGGAGGNGSCSKCVLGDQSCVDEYTSETCTTTAGCNAWSVAPCPQTPVRSHCKPGSGCVQCGSILQDCCPSGLACGDSLECQAGSCLPGPGGAGGSGGTSDTGGAGAIGGQGGSGGLGGSIAPPCGNQDQPCCVPGVPDPCVRSGLACVLSFCRLCGAQNGSPCCSGSKCTNGLSCSAGICSTIDTPQLDAGTGSGGVGGTGGAASGAGGVGADIGAGGAPPPGGTGGTTSLAGGSGSGGVNSVGGQGGLGGAGGSGSADSPDASPDGPSAGIDAPTDSPITLANILQNPGFEDGQQYWDWWQPTSCLAGCSGATLDCQAQCVPTVTSGAGHSGNMGIQLVTTKTSNCTNCFLYQPALTVLKGKSYRISFWARTTDETHIGVGVREHCGCPDLWNAARPSCPPTSGTCSPGTACCYEPYWSYASGGTCSSTCFEAGGNAFIALTMDGTWHQYTVTTSLLGIAGTDQSRSDAKLSLAFSQSIGTVYIDDLEMVELP